jgi:lysophospholipase L1-like esterase
MKSSRAILGLLALLLATGVAWAQGDFYLKDGDRVVFYGDSITEQRLYTTYAETYVVTRFPQLHVTFVHSGVGGDRVAGGWAGPIDLRLPRDVFAYKPTVMTIMLGMNDGSYRAFDPGIFNTYSTGYQHIIDSVKSTLPGVRVTLIQALAL